MILEQNMSKISHTDDVYEAICEQILEGTLPPGEKIHMAELAAFFGVGLSPIREALSRLTATQLVIAKSQRGFIVAPLSIEDLHDIYATRTIIESITLKLSIERGDTEWEANLLASFHRLSRIEKEEAIDSSEKYRAWEKYHRQFNLALISACGLKHLLYIQTQLYRQTERYRRIWFLAGLQKNNVLLFSRKQKGIMEAALARDTKRALDLLESHFEHATNLISKYIASTA